MTKEAVLDLLGTSEDKYLSGAAIARSLSVSRTAVWKAVEQLRAEGYRIESATNKGYRLLPDSDVLSASGIEKHLKNRKLSVQVFRSLSSTNTLLKRFAAEGAPEGLALVTGEQTQGRGRMGRSFYSPADTGVYFSLLLRPAIQAPEATSLTACAAVAVAQAIESISGLETEIKWVNDVLIDGKKVCGILTEASVDCESGLMDYVIVGIGVNTRLPEGDFPEELRGIAGAVFGAERVPELRCRLVAAVLDRLMDYYERLEEKTFYEDYVKRSLVLGREVKLLSPGQSPVTARVLEIDRDFSLIARLTDGTIRRVNSGEVSLRLKEG